MKWTDVFQKVISIGIKLIAAAASVGGAYAFFQEIITPEQSFIELLTSPIAVILYVLLLIVMISVILKEKFKSLQKDNEEQDKRIEELNLALNEASTRLEASERNGQITTFKGRFFMHTEKLYADLSEKIHNDIVISHMDIYNTIEKTGIGNKRDSSVRLSIQGYANTDNVSQIQILTAGDTIVKWNEIDLKAFEIVNDVKIPLKSRLADNGQDSFLKQVVISYGQRKNKGDLINLVIYWKWPNMLNIIEDDYVTLPIALSSETRSVSLTLAPLIPLKFTEVGAYKYQEGQAEVEHIMDLNPTEDNTITFREDNPTFKSSLLLYYKIGK